ncbi:Arylesterase [Ceratocystis fimbriata CBS 114723]|uniref:Arylesterase n=3 Tax=Ceratocystis TaxID=5157 RepID=A0A2C5X4S4_9PEZI|nr:Arylesterase [Ceratocystis fimbriata CBS 114723]
MSSWFDLGSYFQASTDSSPGASRRQPAGNRPARNSYSTMSTSDSPSKTPEISIEHQPDCSEFATSIDGWPRWLLAARVYALRSAASCAFSCITPFPCEMPQTVSTFYLDSTISRDCAPQAIAVDMWMPTPSPALHSARPAIINFHGGGFVIGQGTDDRIWTSYAQQELGAVVFSVNYRLAPGYPFPTPMEDCIDAILQIAARAEEFGISRDQIFLSGFSAGGSLALSSWIVLQDPTRWDYHFELPIPSIKGLALFYPGLDWSISREEKRRGCAQPDLTLPASMTDMFDCSYIYPNRPREGRRDPRLSPGLMEDALLKKMPPTHFCLCEHDMLLAEEFRFISRLKAANRDVTHRIVLDEQHAWDKPMPFAPKPSVMEEYTVTINEIRRWIDPSWMDRGYAPMESMETLSHVKSDSISNSSKRMLPIVVERSISSTSF